MNATPPVDPFGRKTDAELTADLGPLITRRGRSGFERVLLCVVLGLLGSAAAIGVVAGAYAVITQPMMRVGAGLGVFIGALMLALTWHGFRQAFRTIGFHERGLLERTGSKRRVFRYEDLVGLTYALTRQYVNGIYAGTSLVLHIADSTGRKLSFTGSHKERPKGLAITVFGRRFEGEDELDVVRDVISAHIARRLAAEVRAHPIVWGKRVEISTRGVTPRSGKYKGRLMPWSRIGGASAHNGRMHLFTGEEKRSFASIEVATPNFYPGLQLFLSLHGAATGSEAARPAAAA